MIKLKRIFITYFEFCEKTNDFVLHNKDRVDESYYTIESFTDIKRTRRLSDLSVDIYDIYGVVNPCSSSNPNLRYNYLVINTVRDESFYVRYYINIDNDWKLITDQNINEIILYMQNESINNTLNNL